MKGRFLVLFIEKLQAAFPSCASFARFGSTKNGIRGRVKQNYEVNCWTLARQKTKTERSVQALNQMVMNLQISFVILVTQKEVVGSVDSVQRKQGMDGNKWSLREFITFVNQGRFLLNSKIYYIILVCVVMCFMGVRLGQVKK